MEYVTFDDVIISPLKIIPTQNGNVMHGITKSSAGYKSFGEAYFSCIDIGKIKGWKRHFQMTMNFIVPIGIIKIVIAKNKNTVWHFQEIIISKENYCRVTIPPGYWVAFQGLVEGPNILLNIADIEHDPIESENKPLYDISYIW